LGTENIYTSSIQTLCELNRKSQVLGNVAFFSTGKAYFTDNFVDRELRDMLFPAEFNLT